MPKRRKGGAEERGEGPWHLGYKAIAPRLPARRIVDALVSLSGADVMGPRTLSCPSMTSRSDVSLYLETAYSTSNSMAVSQLLTGEGCLHLYTTRGQGASVRLGLIRAALVSHAMELVRSLTSTSTIFLLTSGSSKRLTHWLSLPRQRTV